MIITDEFGRQTVFEGELLVEETTDSSTGSKPQWLEVDVWRTEAGNYIVRRTTRYRIRHANENCDRADGYDLAPATPDDTYDCPSCQRAWPYDSTGFRQTSRITVDVYETPQALISGFQSDGRFNNLARAILANISEQDDRVDVLWNKVVVP
jgi:hypothetical protein